MKMKNLYSGTLMVLILLFSINFTSCDENSTIEVPGPDISYEFSYPDTSIIKTASTGINTKGYVLIAQSDTIKGKDIESFLNKSGQDYTSIVESATISNAILSILSEGSTFSGLDSIKIVYQIVGNSQEIDLAKATINSTNTQTVNISDLKIEKAQAFDLIKNNVIAKLYAAASPQVENNWFKPGVTYKFTANTTLTVKIASLSGLLGKSE